MKTILKIDNPNVYAQSVDAPVLHPQIAVVSYDEVSPIHSSLNNYGVYGLFIQQQFPKYLSYGTKSIVAGERSIIAVAPGQVGGAEDNGTPLYINGWALLWSGELLSPAYPFFSYFSTEALRMEPQEWERISLLVSTLRAELRENVDSPAFRAVITGYLQLILGYCNRIYLRQISEKEQGDSDILKRFHRLLVDYFTKGLQHEKGIPTVGWCASELAYSASYFGDLVVGEAVEVQEEEFLFVVGQLVDEVVEVFASWVGFFGEGVDEVFVKGYEFVTFFLFAFAQFHACGVEGYAVDPGGGVAFAAEFRPSAP